MENMIGKKVGSGGTSDVFEWGNTEVIKIYKSHVADDVINNEEFIGQLLNKYLLDIPKMNGSILYNGRKALIYERINGKIMAEQLLKGFYKKEDAIQFAQIHFEIHNKELNELPSQYNFLKNRILELLNILGDKTKILLDLLDSIPIDNKLCHGDLQPLNIIRVADKYVAIDWNGACSGNPILDVAWSYITLKSPIIKTLLGETISEVFMNFSTDYLSHYCKLSGMKQEKVFKYLPIVATRRLYDNLQCDNENSRLERDWLFEFIRNQ